MKRIVLLFVAVLCSLVANGKTERNNYVELSGKLGLKRYGYQFIEFSTDLSYARTYNLTDAFSVGAGLGCQYSQKRINGVDLWNDEAKIVWSHEPDISFPIFVRARYDFASSSILQPYAQLDSGYSMNLGQIMNYHGYRVIGPFIHPQIGVGIGKYFLIGVGLNTYRYDMQDGDWGTTVTLYSISLNLGVRF